MPIPKLSRYLTIALGLSGVSLAHAETIGGGTIATPAVAPAPSFGIGGSGFVPVKNWNFGTDANSTIRNQAEMNANFTYHDPFNTFTNKYGSQIVAPDVASRLNTWQKVELVDTANKKVREFFTGSLKTYLVPMEDANGNPVTDITPEARNCGNGSFMARWAVPKAGSYLNQDIIWETRVRYVTPKFFWFSIWACGDDWNHGGEADIIESYGEDRPAGRPWPSSYQNYDGRFWHSGVVAGSNAVNYHASWQNGMILRGITSYDATQYHIWTWHYRANNTYSIYVDGVEVQNGTQIWTEDGTSTPPPEPVYFLFDGAWGHQENTYLKERTLAASELVGKYYEWDYSRVYLGPPTPTTVVPHANTWYRVSSQANPTKALHDSGGLYASDSNGTYTLSMPWNSTADGQKWKFSDAGSGHFRIYSKGKWAKALHDAAQVYSGDAAGNYQITYPYTVASDWQKWKLVSLGAGYYRFYSKHRTNRALHESAQVYTPSPTGNYIISYPWNSTLPVQKWQLIPQ